MKQYEKIKNKYKQRVVRKGIQMAFKYLKRLSILLITSKMLIKVMRSAEKLVIYFCWVNVITHTFLIRLV